MLQEQGLSFGILACRGHRQPHCHGLWVWQRDVRRQNQNSQNEPGMSFRINETKKRVPKGTDCNRHFGKPQAVPNEVRKESRRARIFSLVATVNPVFGLTVGS